MKLVSGACPQCTTVVPVYGVHPRNVSMGHADSVCLQSIPAGPISGLHPQSTFKGMSGGHIRGVQTCPLHFAVRMPGVQASRLSPMSLRHILRRGPGLRVEEQ